MAPLGCKFPRFQHLIRFDFCYCPIGRDTFLSRSEVALHITWFWIRYWLSSPPKNLFSVTDCKKTDYVTLTKSLFTGPIDFPILLFRFILWIRHTIHRFRFTGLKIFMPLNNIQLYLQNLVIPSMTRLDTLVNGALIVHWPLAGKIHGEHWLWNRHGWERRSILVLFSSV